jgi:hypothetical protein
VTKEKMSSHKSTFHDKRQFFAQKEIDEHTKKNSNSNGDIKRKSESTKEPSITETPQARDNISFSSAASSSASEVDSGRCQALYQLYANIREGNSSKFSSTLHAYVEEEGGRLSRSQIHWLLHEAVARRRNYIIGSILVNTFSMQMIQLTRDPPSAMCRHLQEQASQWKMSVKEVMARLSRINEALETGPLSTFIRIWKEKDGKEEEDTKTLRDTLRDIVFTNNEAEGPKHFPLYLVKLLCIRGNNLSTLLQIQETLKITDSMFWLVDTSPFSSASLSESVTTMETTNGFRDTKQESIILPPSCMDEFRHIRQHHLRRLYSSTMASIEASYINQLLFVPCSPWEASVYFRSRECLDHILKVLENDEGQRSQHETILCEIVNQACYTHQDDALEKIVATFPEYVPSFLILDGPLYSIQTKDYDTISVLYRSFNSSMVHTWKSLSKCVYLHLTMAAQNRQPHMVDLITRQGPPYSWLSHGDLETIPVNPLCEIATSEDTVDSVIRPIVHSIVVEWKAKELLHRSAYLLHELLSHRVYYSGNESTMDENAKLSVKNIILHQLFWQENDILHRALGNNSTSTSCSGKESTDDKNQPTETSISSYVLYLPFKDMKAIKDGHHEYNKEDNSKCLHTPMEWARKTQRKTVALLNQFGAKL